MTQEEIREAARLAADIIRGEATDIASVPEAATTEGVTTLPAMQGTSLVRVALSLLARAVSAEAGAVVSVAQKERAADRIVYAFNRLGADGSASEAFDITVPAASASGAGLLGTAALGELQTCIAKRADPQTSYNGGSASAKRYIWSTGSNDDRCGVVVSNGTNLVQSGGQLFMRCQVWDPQNLTTTAYTHRIATPAASTSADGVMTKEVFARLGTGSAMYEADSSKIEVKISYPNWAAGGNRFLTISSATSAKAGVMTAADKRLLDEIRAERANQTTGGASPHGLAAEENS